MSNEMAELMTQRAEQVSHEVQLLMKGLGARTQGAILADLVSLWVAGHFERSELGKPPKERKRTQQVRAEILIEWYALMMSLVPESEKEILARVEPQGRG